jgi:hypothetical protein
VLANTDTPQQSGQWQPKKYPLNEVFWEAVYDAFLIDLPL